MLTIILFVVLGIAFAIWITSETVFDDKLVAVILFAVVGLLLGVIIAFILPMDLVKKHKTTLLVPPPNEYSIYFDYDEIRFADTTEFGLKTTEISKLRIIETDSIAKIVYWYAEPSDKLINEFANDNYWDDYFYDIYLPKHTIINKQFTVKQIKTLLKEMQNFHKVVR